MHKKPRRKFLSQIAWGTSSFLLAPASLPTLFEDARLTADLDTEPLFDWSLWEKYRTSVVHPCLTFKPNNVELARENSQRFGWAENYVNNIEQAALHYIHLADESTLESLIEETTPGDPLWTPCPACRDLGKPVHPHGLWNWKIEDFDRL